MATYGVERQLSAQLVNKYVYAMVNILWSTQRVGLDLIRTSLQ